MADSIPQVISEIIAGDALTLSRAAALLPAHRGGGTATQSSVWRWVTAGAKDASGNVVKLEVAKFGGRFLTSKAALARFAAALTGDADTSSPPTHANNRTPAARQKAADAAAKRLAAAGA